MDAAGAELGLLQEGLGRKAGQLLDVAAQEHRPVGRLHRTRVEDDRQAVEDGALALLAAAQGQLRLQLLPVHAGVLGQQPLAVLRLLLHLEGFQVQVDQHLHLGTQDEGVDRLEHHVDSAGRIGLEQVRLVTEHGGQEDDGNPAGLAPLPDVAGRLVAIHARHVQVQQDDREVLQQQPLQGLVAGVRHHDLVAKLLQRAGGREQVALVVVDDQHARAQWLGLVSREGAGWTGQAGTGSVRRHGAQLACGSRLTMLSDASLRASARRIATLRTEISWSMSTGLET